MRDRRASAYKMHDSAGLYLIVTQVVGNGGAQIRIGGKEKLLSLGVYPEVPLAIRSNATAKRGSRHHQGCARVPGEAPALWRRGSTRATSARPTSGTPPCAATAFESVGPRVVRQASADMDRGSRCDVLRALEGQPVPEARRTSIGEIDAPSC